MIQYFDDKDIACFNGFSFRLDKKTGYYLSSKLIDGKRKRLHVYVWEYYKGSVPEGLHVHHIDGDKSNNEIDNLTIITASEHSSHHRNTWSDERRNKQVDILKKYATPKAAEWHGSEKGIEWHKLHYESVKEKLHVKGEFTCIMCGKNFMAVKTSNNKFCSNKCKSAYRRKSGVDNETRKCAICGREFVTNKYSKAKTCSTRCRSQLRKNKVNS